MLRSPEALARLADRIEIEDVLTRWTVAFDEADWDSMRACMAQDVVARTVRPDTGEPEETRGADQVVAIAQTRRAWFSQSQHFHVSLIVDIDADQAHARAFHVGYLTQQGQSAPAAGSFTGRYELRRMDGVWLLVASNQIPAWFLWPPVSPTSS